ncbi:hypothetical protein M426DRAFT_58416 [Hypoxylon sp. CI-4A]|nr:hypothetical protein M426DRAFT_58416 [Hypoxylon sp. CI-4A]
MKKWKELGEVPDSDDESGFDSSEESEHELPTERTDPRVEDAPAVDGLSIEDRDVWDIPSSSQVSGHEHTKAKEPILTVPQPLTLLPASQPVQKPTEPGSVDSSPLSSPRLEPTDDPLTPIQSVNIEKEESDKPEVPEEVPPIPTNQFVDTRFEVGDISDEGERESLREVVRLERSLRPRKPIQEHPYLLDFAQYSKTLKSHGVRPLRMQAEEAARRKRQEEDSQEQDYEEESQSTARGIAPDDSEESQGVQRPALPDENDEEDVAQLRSSPPPLHESRDTTSETPLGSSQVDEEFPDPADVEKWNLGKRRTANTKRQASPRVSKKRKLPRLHQPVRLVREAREASPPFDVDDIFNIPPSPPQTSPNFLNVTPVAAVGRPKHVTTLTPKHSSTISSRNPSPAPANRSSNMIDLTLMGNEDESQGEQDMGPSSDSESDSEMVRANISRRMRGVLPASWLRLDRPGARQQNARVPRHSPDPSPERTQRKGVAQRRQVSPRPGNSTALFLDDSDDDDTIIPLDDVNESRDANPSTIPIFEDDAGSVVEEDHIDYMLPGNKRAMTDSDEPNRPRKRRKNQQSLFKAQSDQPKRQQRITGLLKNPKTTTQKNVKKRGLQNVGRGHRSKETGGRTIRPASPPRLSILDVIEPDAPPFLRIAARTANRRQDRGRSSPSKKHIALATRSDNIDATAVLRDWKRGHIQQRTSSNVGTRPRADLPKPLHPLSHNSVVQPLGTTSKPRPTRVVPSSRFSQPRRMTKQMNIDNFVTVDPGVLSTNTQPPLGVPLARRSYIGRSKSYNTNSRPAQLETANEQIGRHTFHTRKRALDAIYRKSHRALPAPASIGLEQLVDRSAPVERSINESLLNSGPSISEPAPMRRRSKFRKRFQPRQVDTTAPQYAHAHDPLPPEVISASSASESVHTPESTGKLLGLGPFGTHYTQHFEIFPLDLGVYFHESTLLGSGRLSKAFEDKTRDTLHQLRGRSTFILDEKRLQWSEWNAQTSSELGIVFDWIGEYLHSSLSDVGNTSPVNAADFVLEYLQNHVSFFDGEGEKHFADRALEVLQSFAQRLEALRPQPRDRARPLIDVLSRSLVILLQTLRICNNLGQLSGIFELEDTLKRIAKRAARELFEAELTDVRGLYSDLQRLSFREKGIRNEHYSVVCWVVLMRVLEESHIPRSGFWDVVSSVMLSIDPNSIADAHIFERVWCDLFTLLPLGEFDSTGVLIPGLRHTLPLEGWVLPQKLLKRVFQLYESNSRQAPSFNDYCRGVVSRCHYLVEQWGWRKSNGIIGTIFDFFAARGLSHLRNEEVYKSPEFLEHLAESPSLAIVPEDKCFHIFLKLLALSIQRFESHGLNKDTRNLVARVLPNHNRQYDREQDIHESDLAALRNHHDLLCTLYWATPSSLRPSVQTIEKLVLPGSSHKEACLISLRAWCQLSRFVISSNEDTAAYKPFADWQKNIFQQVIEQYLSAESDIQQQLAKMSKDASKDISRDMMNAVIKMNRKGAMDVIYSSMKGFLGVIRCATTLNVVSFALNHFQIDQVFTRFPFSSADFDWSSLRVALDILDYYVTRIEEFFNRSPATADHSWHGEDAIMLLERKMIAPFFSMARTVVGMDYRDTELGPISHHSMCIEQTVSLAGRLASRLIHSRLLRISQFFAAGRHSIFQKPPQAINSPSRRYHALFLTALIERGMTDFKDLGMSTLDLFLLELVKPFHFLSYENRLALVLKQRGDPYLKGATIETSVNPNYSSNRCLFAYVVATMRKRLRSAETAQKPQLQSQFSKALRNTMDQMKLDLKSMTLDSPEHADYIGFVRSIVSVIRSQDLCPVDSYFYQISREYSPSSQDPRLQIAGILSWGLKLEDGDAKAVSGLFYLLFPNFKIALTNGKLGEEIGILQQGMGNPRVFSFMLSGMFPAIIKSALEESKGWILLDTYVDAFEAALMTPSIYKAIGMEDMNGLLSLFEYTFDGVRHLQTLDTADIHPEHIYTLIQIIRLMNLLSPSFTAFLINEPNSQAAMDITEAISVFTVFTREADEYLSSIFAKPTNSSAPIAADVVVINSTRLFQGARVFSTGSVSGSNEHINRFANHMIRDIKDNWVSDGLTVTVRGPSRPQGQLSTQTGQGTVVTRWDTKELLQILNGQLKEWNYIHDLATPRQTAWPVDQFLF